MTTAAHRFSALRLITLMMLLSAVAAASDQVVFGQDVKKLTLPECIDIALIHQPRLHSAEGLREAAAGKKLQSSSPYYPQILASTGYSENHAMGAFGDSVTKGYQSTLSVSQLLYDFGRTGGSSDAAAANVASSRDEKDRIVQEVVLAVQQAYFALLLDQKLVDVANKTLEQSEAHLKQATAFFNAGAKPRFDVTRAEVEVNNARLGLITATNNVRLGKITLNNAMGVDPAAAVEINDLLAPPAAIPDLSAAQADALRNRPEMRKAEADREAQQALLRSARAGYFPNITANGSYSWANGTSEYGTMFKGDLGDSWSAAITLSVPLFEGGVTAGRIAETKGNLLSAEAQRDMLKQSILIEVNQAYADYDSASARIQVMDSSLKKARENLDLAQGRYAAGVGPYIEVTDAQVAAVKAEIDFLQARYDLQLAVARVQKAIGAAEVR